MTRNKIGLLFLIFIFLLPDFGLGQESGAVYRRSGILNGNQVKTVFGNWGVIGQPANKGPRGAWIYDTNGYVGDVSPLVAAEVPGQYQYHGGMRDTTFHWVIDCPVDRPSSGGFDQTPTGVRRAFEPVRGYFNEAYNSPAISSNKNSWPSSWPDKMNDASDPGWPGSWNGLFGKVPNADLETYFVMDDNADDEFSNPNNNEFQLQFLPDSTNPQRHGLGLTVRVRGLQWQQILAQDNIFWVYEIKNEGDYTYPRTSFGMLVGTYVGVTGADDTPQEYNDDWSFFDVAEDLTYTGDYPPPGDCSDNPFWQGPVGLVGYAFLESPGNPFDGIDNDHDAENGQTLTSPLFTENDFAPVTLVNTIPGQGERNKIVTIQKVVEHSNLYNKDIVKYIRKVITLKSPDTTVVSLGDTFHIVAGVTSVVEGNVVTVAGVQRISSNAYDGKDNDLDGLIDENYYLHYRQVRVDAQGNVLFDIINPVRYVNYINGNGLDDEMVDERRDDGLDNDHDWSRNQITGALIYDENGNLIDDVGADGIPGTGDFGEYDGVPTPGEPNFDQTDKDESDQIGLASFQYFVPAGDIAMWDDEEMWGRMRPGYFDVPASIQNGQPTAGEDGDFVYSSGYFPLTAGQTERLSLALIYAWTRDEMIQKLKTVRTIYNADYRFPVAPQKPTVRAVAGDNSVTLYWDRAAEQSFDPILRTYDFEGYKIYRSTDPAFNDAYVVTNSSGSVASYKALKVFDLKDGIQGWYYPPYKIQQTLQGWSYYLGSDSGLVHSYVDNEVENGRTYYYAVVSYDRGSVFTNALGEVLDTTGVIPSECTKQITQGSTGEITLDINTVAVTPSAPVAGYKTPKTTEDLQHEKGDGFGTVQYNVIDPTALTGHDYELYFWDTSNDGIDNNHNWTLADDVGEDGIANTHDKGEGDGKPTPGEPNLDFRDPKELEAITTHYAVKDLYEYIDRFVANDTNDVTLPRENVDQASVIVQDELSNVIPDSLYTLDYARGKIRASYHGALDNKTYMIRYQYHPVYFSEYMQGNPALVRVKDADNFDGLNLTFNNIWRTESAGVTPKWNNPDVNYGFQFNFEVSSLPGGIKLKPVYFPSNYELRISDHVVDTTSALYSTIIPPTPRKFSIYNTTGGYKVEYFHGDMDGDMLPSVNERVAFFEKDPEGQFTIYTWQFTLTPPDSGQPYQFVGGEVLDLKSKFPFNKFDKFTFRTEMPEVVASEAKNSLDEIRVVPNPYIVSHEFEPPLPPSVTSGRGERRIYFTHLPQNAKIYIFTARGEHVATLEGDNSLFNGTITWDLKTKENLDIAYGVYFYVVDSPAGKKRGKFAVIK